VSGLSFAAGLFVFAGGPVVAALVSGLLFGVLSGRPGSKRWRTGDGLNPEDRSAVVRLVLGGEGPQDRRLAAAAIDFAQIQGVAASGHERWLPVLLVALVGWAVFAAAGGHVVTAAFLWATTVLVVAGRAGRLSRADRARVRSNADRAETEARALLLAATPRCDVGP